MLKDRVIRIRLKKYFHEQKPLCYVGKCTDMNDSWVVVDGRALMIARNAPDNVQIDKKSAYIVIPRDNIESIRVLPDTFDVENMKITTEGQQLRLVVDGKRDCMIGELGEG